MGLPLCLVWGNPEVRHDRSWEVCAFKGLIDCGLHACIEYRERSGLAANGAGSLGLLGGETGRNRSPREQG